MQAAAIILPALGGLDVYKPWPLPAELENQLVNAFMERYSQAEQAVSSERAAISAGMAAGYMVRYLPEWDDYHKSLFR